LISSRYVLTAAHCIDDTKWTMWVFKAEFYSFLLLKNGQKHFLINEGKYGIYYLKQIYFCPPLID
jgi:V8-like Glu-specific endopeptidase